MVTAAYSSGTPAFGVGVGNCVHVVDETADLTDAADAIAIAKTFDYATSCLADNSVIAHTDVYDALLGLLRARGGHLCSAAEKEQLQAAMWPDGGPAEANVEWVRKAWSTLKKYSTGGNYINFQTYDESPERTAEAYRGNLARLAEIKAEYDPENLFRVNRNIAPSRG